MSKRGDDLIENLVADTPGATPTAGGARKRSPVREARRAAVRQRAAERAAAARRKRLVITSVVAVVLIAVVAGIVMLTASTKPAAKATAKSSAQAGAAAPNLPAAFATEPKITAGTGTVSALKVTTLIKGTGAPVKAGQNITVNYVGATYKDGKVFDSSWKNGQPFSTVIGQGQVIPGWDQGLVGVPVGSRVQLDIPANLAYGDNPGNGAPGGALRFIVDVRAAK